MRVALAALCESVTAREDGRIDLVGAVPDQLAVEGFPWSGNLSFALVLQLAPEDDRNQLGLNVSVVDATDGSVVGGVDPSSARQPREVPVGVAIPIHVPFELGLQVTLPQPGRYAVLVRNPTGDELARVDITAVVRG